MNKILKVFTLALMAGTFAGCTDTDGDAKPAPAKNAPAANNGNKPAEVPAAGAMPAALVGTWTYYGVRLVDKNNQTQEAAATGTLEIAAQGTFKSDVTVGAQNLKEQGTCTATDTTVHTVGAEGAADFVYQIGDEQLQDGSKVKTLALQQNLADGTTQVFFAYRKI